MNLKASTVFLLLLSLLAIVAYGEEPKKENAEKDTSRSSAEIQWHDFNEGLELAKAEGKNVFIEFYTDWCGYCKKMDKTTFKDPQVIGMINKNYVPIRVNGDSRDTVDVDGWITDERNLTRSEYGVTGYPTYVFLESDGAKITKLPGYQRSDRLLTVLDYLKSDLYKKVTFKEYLSEKTAPSTKEKEKP